MGDFLEFGDPFVASGTVGHLTLFDVKTLKGDNGQLNYIHFEEESSVFKGIRDHTIYSMDWFSQDKLLIGSYFKDIGVINSKHRENEPLVGFIGGKGTGCVFCISSVSGTPFCVCGTSSKETYLVNVENKKLEMKRKFNNGSVRDICSIHKYRNNQAVSGSLDKTIVLFDFERMKQIKKSETLSYCYGVDYNAYNSLIVANCNGTLVMDLNTSKVIKTLLSTKLNQIFSVKFLSGNCSNYFVVGDANGRVARYDIRNLKSSKSLFCSKNHKGWVNRIVNLDDGYFATCGEQGIVNFWNLEKEKPIARYRNDKFSFFSAGYFLNERISVLRIQSTQDRTERIGFLQRLLLGEKEKGLKSVKSVQLVVGGEVFGRFCKVFFIT